MLQFDVLYICLVQRILARKDRRRLGFKSVDKMIPFMGAKEKLKEVDRCLDSQLWHACAGGMVQMPAVNSRVFYFPQGHAEHATGNVEFRNIPRRVPAYVLCRVFAIKFMADDETDEVYARIRLIPVSGNEYDAEDDFGGINGNDTQEKPSSFAKTLTQSDANNGGGFSVPRYCAETIFPRLDYSADPPVQTILAKDVHGETWKFRHIYRGTPRRHLLTTGWSTFVNHKKLVAGDSIVFLRAENGDLCVGIRRAKRWIGGGGSEFAPEWSPAGGNCMIPYGGFSAFLRDDENKLTRKGNGVSSSNGVSSAIGKEGRVRPESVVESVSLAASGQTFEVVYYPRASTPEFCVKASMVKSALQIRWTPGMRFKMPFETEDSSRISWFMGTISSVQVADPIRWPDSPWRLLQVTWDEPDLLQNVKRVSPWLVELVSNMPAIHLSPFSPPRKKLRLPHHADLALDGQIPLPSFSGNFLGSGSSFGCLTDNTPAGMQGARHAQYGLPLSDFNLNRYQSCLFPPGFPPLDHGALPTRAPHILPTVQKPSNEGVSCFLTIGNGNQGSKKSDDSKPPQFVLFGQPIHTEEQMSLSCSGNTENSSSEGHIEKTDKLTNGSHSSLQQLGTSQQRSCDGIKRLKDKYHESESNTDNIGICKVYMKADDVGRTLDLSLIKSYDELYRRLADLFGVENHEVLNRSLYQDGMGSIRHVGDEPFSDFMKSAKKLTVVRDGSSNSKVEGGGRRR